MGKRFGFSSLFFRVKESPTCSPPSYSWPWPSCKHPRTSSFRAGKGDVDVVFKTVNSVYFDSPESSFTNSSESFTTVSEDGDAAEAVIRGLRSDRLFFEPGDTSSILVEEAKAESEAGGVPFEESVVVAMESEDPYCDFRASMEEMVEAYGLREWEGLEELLVWYLRVNGRKTHGFIVGAFVDLIVGLANPPPPSSSSSSSSSSSVLFGIEEVKDEEDSPSTSSSNVTMST